MLRGRRRGWVQGLAGLLLCVVAVVGIALEFDGRNAWEDPAQSPNAVASRNMRALVVLEEALGCNPCSNIMRRSGSDGCQKCSRITLGFLNVAFFIVGCLFIAAGSIVKSNYQGTIFSLNTTLINPRDAQDLRDFAHLAPISLIVLGSVVTLVSLIGCIGSSFEKRYLLIIYCSFITLIIAAEIAVGGYAIAKQENFGQLGADLVNSGFNQPGSRPLFDIICSQRGLSPSTDFTCDSALNATQASCASCVQLVLNDNMNLVGIALVVVGCVEIIALVLACKSMPMPSSHPFVHVDVDRPNQPTYVAHQNAPRANAQRMPL